MDAKTKDRQDFDVMMQSFRKDIVFYCIKLNCTNNRVFVSQNSAK